MVVFIRPPLIRGSTKVSRPTLREHAGLFGGGGAVQLIEHTGGEVVCLDLVVLDHLPDPWRLRTDGPGRIGAGDHPGRSPGWAMWSIPLIPHMSPAAIGCTLVSLLRGLGLAVALSDAGEHRVGAAEPGRGVHGDDVAVDGSRSAASRAVSTRGVCIALLAVRARAARRGCRATVGRPAPVVACAAWSAISLLGQVLAERRVFIWSNPTATRIRTPMAICR